MEPPRQNIFNSIAEQLTDPNQNLSVILDRFIKFAVNLVNTVGELQEEIIDKNFVIQMNITDVGFNFWLRVDNGKVIYTKGVSEEATIKADLTRDQVIRMIKGELKATDAFMKGNLKASGSLGHGLLFIRIFRLIIKYLNENTKRKTK